MSWKSVHKEDNAFLLDDPFNHHVPEVVLVDVWFLSNQNASTISFVTSHLFINCSQLQATIIEFLEAIDMTEATSDQESCLLGWKETHSCVWESKELQTWDLRQNSRYGEYVELYETFCKLVK